VDLVIGKRHKNESSQDLKDCGGIDFRRPSYSKTIWESDGGTKDESTKSEHSGNAIFKGYLRLVMSWSLKTSD